VTGDALDFALETLGVQTPGLRDRLMTLYLTLDAFPEVPSVLASLKRAGLQTAILSNGSPKMLDAVVKGAKLDGLLDVVLSVEEVGVYKPHPKVYQLARLDFLRDFYPFQRLRGARCLKHSLGQHGLPVAIWFSSSPCRPRLWARRRGGQGYDRPAQ
jgi:beta-phosphoglucomutase-like phosphatase (HAD superfamily)